MVIIILLLMIYDQACKLPNMKATVMDRLVFLTFSLCTQVNH